MPLDLLVVKIICSVMERSSLTPLSVSSEPGSSSLVTHSSVKVPLLVTEPGPFGALQGRDGPQGETVDKWGRRWTLRVGVVAGPVKWTIGANANIGHN